MTTRTPHPSADLICAWANGFRVEFRYVFQAPGNPEKLYMPDTKWHLCGKHYSAFSGINEHRIHADDLAAWESFKCNLAEDAAKPVGYLIRKLEMVMPLMEEARDALTVLTTTQIKLRHISPTLATRMDEVGTYSVEEWLKNPS